MVLLRAILLLGCLCVSTGSQGELLRFKHIGFADGLPSNFVTAITQRRNGFIWIGTVSGLVRFDGREQQVFRHQHGNPETPISNWVLDLHEDTHGRLWIATDSGLNRLDDASGTFEQYIHRPEQPDSLAGTRVNDIFEDSQGRLWFATDNGVSRYRPESNDFQSYRPPPNVQHAEQSKRIRFVIEDRQGAIWIGSEYGLYSLDAVSTRLLPVRAKDVAVDAILTTAFFTRAIEDRNGTLWIGTDANGLLRRSTDTLQFTLMQNPGHSDSISANSIWSFAEDRDGRLWVGSYGEGISILDPERRGVQHYRAYDADDFSLPSDIVYRMFVDAAGVVWLGTGDGVAVLKPMSPQMEHLTHIPGKTSSLIARHVWSIAETDDGNIWIGTESGLSHWQKGLTQFSNHRLQTISASDPGNGTYWSLHHSGGSIWLGTDRGLQAFDPSNGEFRRLHDREEASAALGSYPVYAIQQGPGADLWVAQDVIGLYRYSPTSGAHRIYGPSWEGANGLPLSSITSMLAQTPVRLWLGTEYGLLHFDADAEQLQRPGGEASNDRLANTLINSLYHDAATNKLWVATEGDGLFQLDLGNNPAETRVAAHFSIEQGLPDTSVTSVIGDEQGGIWLTTSAGLSSLDAVSGAWTHFRSLLERKTMRFNERAVMRSHDGKLLFGGTRGFIRFDPTTLQRSDYEPPVLLTSVASINNSGKATTLSRIPSRLTVDHDFSLVNIRFAALDYGAPLHNRYAYRLLGQDQEWIDLGTDNKVALRNIAPGSYVFQVRGSNRDGVWSGEQASLKLVVRPPPWRQPWAYGLYLLLLMMLGSLTAMYWRRQLAQQAAIATNERRLKVALWGSGDELWEWNRDTGSVRRSNSLPFLPSNDQRFHGDVEALYEATHPDDRNALQAAMTGILEHRQDEFEALYRLRDIDGNWKWLLDRGRVYARHDDGSPASIVGTIKNIDDIMRTEEQLHLVASAFQQSGDGVVICDTDFVIEFANKAFEQITGQNFDTQRGLAIELDRFADETGAGDGATLRIRAERALQETGGFHEELWYRQDDGSRVPVSMRINVVRNSQNQITHYIAALIDISFRKQAEQELRRLANFDELTGLPNRTLFQDRLLHALAHARRAKQRLALLFIDLDHFKNVNDTLGHAAGDELLRRVAEQLKLCTRSADTVARLGGDEFTIVLEDVQAQEDVSIVAGKVIESVSQTFSIAMHDVLVSPSIGIAFFPEHGNDAETLLKNSDIAMYHAKREGRNNYQYFVPDMNALLVDRLALEKRLRHAIEIEQFELYYQPQFATADERIVGLEALLRWPLPREGMIPPSRFIPVAEDAGLIAPLGDWVLRRACKQMVDWLNSGVRLGKVAINLSARQFQNRELIADVNQVLNETGLAAEYLELEITEGTLVKNMDYAIETLHGLRAMGVRLALDDFGTGYSSLNYLKKFPIHTLKIDRSFIADVTVNDQDARLVRSIIELAHNLDIEVIAEGVETAAQLDFLRSSGCEEVQGFLLGKPQPVSELEKFLHGDAQTPGVSVIPH